MAGTPPAAVGILLYFRIFVPSRTAPAVGATAIEVVWVPLIATDVVELESSLIVVVLILVNGNASPTSQVPRLPRTIPTALVAPVAVTQMPIVFGICPAT